MTGVYARSCDICATWREANKICYEYLNDLDKPIAILRASTSSSNTNGVNCCVREGSMPMATPLCVGARVMLLCNMCVEENLINGSVGRVKDICFHQNAIYGEPGAKV